MAEYLLDVLRGVWIAWSAPEFDWLRWALIGGMVGEVLGYVARMDWARVTRTEGKQ